jgi:RNA recognition motif-containing protein
MRLDRFTFHNDTMCFVELGSKEEAAKAVERLNGTELQGKKIVVQPLKAEFQWGPQGERNSSPWGNHLFYDEGDGASKALRPLAEGRRFMLRVATPGWTADNVSNQKKDAIRIIQQTFDKYGVEKVSQIHPFYGDKKKNPRLLCFMDFKTKEGADEAVRNHHDTDIEGRKTWLTPCSPTSYRAHHMAKVAPQLAIDLQEQGILTKETREDLFVNPPPEKERR